MTIDETYFKKEENRYTMDDLVKKGLNVDEYVEVGGLYSKKGSKIVEILLKKYKERKDSEIDKEIKGKKVEKSQELVSNLDIDNSNDDESDNDDNLQHTWLLQQENCVGANPE